MTKQVIGVGAVANDGTGDPLRTAFGKVNDNFTEIYDGLGGVVAKSGAAVSHTGDTIETALATITIPAGALGANGIIRVMSIVAMTSSANIKTLRVRLGGLAGAAIFTSSLFTTVSSPRIDVLTFAANATNSQNTQGWCPRATDNLVTGSAIVTSALDMTAAQDLVISGQLASASEGIQLLGYTVQVIK